MEDIRPNKVTLFDTTYTNTTLCMFKVLLPFLPASMQGNFAVYIKYMELQYTIQYYKQQAAHHKPSFALQQTDISSSESPFPFHNIYDELLPYCNASQKQQFLQIRHLFETMRNMQDMMEMLETMKELFPEGMSNTENEQGGFSPEMLAAMSGMLGGGNMDFTAMADYFTGGG